MDEPTTITCPCCDESFYVVWNRSATTGNGPDFCPFCGDEIDYAALQSEASA